MRPVNQEARSQLETVLARRSSVSAPELAAALGVSVPTLHRMLPELAGRVVVTGKARRTRYALRRGLRGELAELPIYQVDEAGRAHPLTKLALVRPQGSWMSLEGTDWPVPQEARDGWWDGLPYPLYDMRPQGYMGRQLARAEHRQLEVSADPKEWSDDDVVHVLSRSGSDVSGNLILGDRAYERWLQAKLAPAELLKADAVGPTYASLAEQAIATGVPGSSAAGEFPKFSALRELPGSLTPHVLVKFSGALSGDDGSSAVRRWSDLLVCEHLALACAGQLSGVESARSRVVMHAGRTFLEVERFDRHGLFGRSPLASLETVNAAFIGESTNDWARLAQRLAGVRLLSADAALRIERLWWFGRLIANTDMHLGNLSFRPRGVFEPAPAYDMPPMLYAPLAGGEVPTRAFEPPLPLPAQRAVWTQACEAAVVFWQRASADSRISEAFRATCAANAVRLVEVAQHV
ncbi:MAG: phosphatidylinositol kinase [Rhizobacter sp.]|nr:phosphatidylinositol kinase [Rhizobacter sp.]